jgi:hypothetical protein
MMFQNININIIFAQYNKNQHTMHSRYTNNSTNNPMSMPVQDPFYGVPNGVAYCQQERTEELSQRMRDRNIPSAPLQPQLGARPVLSKYAIMPILDQRKPATVPIANYPIYNPAQVFNPGSAVAPWSGYATAVNVESTLRNQFFALQKCEQSEYVPSSKSDLYNVRIDSRQIPQPHPLLFKSEKFAPVNPDCFHLANRVFNNSTRTELKNVE